jgi:hypothetical protein
VCVCVCVLHFMHRLRNILTVLLGVYSTEIIKDIYIYISHTIIVWDIIVWDIYISHTIKLITNSKKSENSISNQELVG